MQFKDDSLNRPIIVGVLARAKSGATQPFLCGAQDGQQFYVKGVGAGARSVVCEWLAGCLAQAFGLPIAPFEIVEIPQALNATSPMIRLEGLSLARDGHVLAAPMELRIPASGLIDYEACDMASENGGIAMNLRSLIPIGRDRLEN